MNIAEFCAARNLKHARVANYIKRHQEIFKDHTTRKKNSLELDEVALAHLNDKYPLPHPVQIIEDTQTLRELIKAQDRLIQLQEELKSLQGYKYALEQKELEFEQISKDLTDTKDELARYKKTIFGLYKKLPPSDKGK